MNDFQDLLRVLVESDATDSLGIPTREPERGYGSGDSFLAKRGAAGSEVSKRDYGTGGVPDNWGKEGDDAKRMERFGKTIGGVDDPVEAIKQWADGQAQEWNALKSRIYIALRLLKELYSTLPGYNASTAVPAAPKSQASALASMGSQFDAMMKKKIGAPSAAPTQPAPGGTA